MTLPPPQFSEDGSLWWDGGQWLDATQAPTPLLPTPQPQPYGPAPGADAFGPVPRTSRTTAAGMDLLPDEQVLREARSHWWSASWPAAGFVGLGLLYVPLLLMASGFAALAAMVFWSIPAAIALGIGKLRRDRSCFVLTDQRLLVSQGVLRRTSSELLLRQVESATISRSLVSDVLGYGDIAVCGTGGNVQVLRGVIAPQDFRAQVQRAVAGAQKLSS